MDKCVCHINGYEVKDSKARETLSEHSEKLTKLSETLAGLSEGVSNSLVGFEKVELNFWQFNLLDFALAKCSKGLIDLIILENYGYYPENDSVFFTELKNIGFNGNLLGKFGDCKIRVHDIDSNTYSWKDVPYDYDLSIINLPEEYVSSLTLYIRVTPLEV